MNAATVAKRTLLDARRIVEASHQAIYLNAIQADDHGDLVAYYYRPSYAPGPWWAVAMSEVTIDGYTVRNTHDHYGTYIFGWKDDESGDCRTDENGTCLCRPREYVPRKQDAGEICEPCWLKWGAVQGVNECEWNGHVG